MKSLSCSSLQFDLTRCPDARDAGATDSRNRARPTGGVGRAPSWICRPTTFIPNLQGGVGLLPHLVLPVPAALVFAVNHSLRKNCTATERLSVVFRRTLSLNDLRRDE